MEEALIKRIMPNNLEAEQSVIGAMIMDREAIMIASETLVREDFYYQQYGVLFETMAELYNEEQPVDVITLQNRLREKDGMSFEHWREIFEEKYHLGKNRSADDKVL